MPEENKKPQNDPEQSEPVRESSVPTEDIPFDLPHVTDLPADPPKDSEDESKMYTLPVYPDSQSDRRDDPNVTLPGTGGLDPNPDYVAQQTVPSPPNRRQSASVHNQATYPQPARQHSAPPQPRNNIPAPPPPRNQTIRKLLPRRSQRGFRPGCLWIFIGLFVTFCGGLTILTGTAAAIFIPRIEEQWDERIAEVDDYRAFESTFIYDRHGELLFEAFGEGRRQSVPYQRFPQHLIQATVAIEDDSFFGNIGIDVGATTVAFMQYLGADEGEDTAGGSTITQQLVRNVLFDFEKRSARSAQRKAEEILLAILLTQRKSKEEILGLYLNEIYYGNLAYGAQAAAQVFFAKDVENLSLGEAALLAGLPQAPAELNPLNPDPAVQAAVIARWRLVLDLMVEERFITSEQRDQTLAQGLNFVPTQISLDAPHFTVYAQNELESLMGELGYTPEDIVDGGWHVYTTVDQRINDLATRAARDQVAQLTRNNVSNASVVVLKPITGEILGMVGSVDYNNDAIDGRVNVTIALRQPGSTMKPFTYSAAIERGMTPGDVIWDTPTEIGIPGQPLYQPVNYDNRYHGPMRMRTALANSYNIPAVQTLRLVGVDYLLQLMHRFGAESLGTDAGRYGLSLTLGGGEISPLELTNAYAVFANQGSYVPVTSILCVIDNDDNILYQYENSCPRGRPTNNTVESNGFGTQVLDPRIAYLISDILGDNASRSEAMGANSPLRTDGIASSVKTGTTDDVKDNWTVGYTRNVAVGVWVGNNNGDPLVNSSGLTGAAPIWNAVLTGIYNNQEMLGSLLVGGQLLPDEYNPPPGMSVREICDVRSLSDPALQCPRRVNEWFLDGPAGIPDDQGNLYYPESQPLAQQNLPNSSLLQQVSPGVYQANVYPIPPDVAASIRFQLNAGDKQPLPPQYCRVPQNLVGVASSVGARDQLFITTPVTSQSDAVEAERYARNSGLAILPTIDCWQDILQAQSFGAQVTTAVITSPAPYQVVTGVIPIIGTVQFSPDQAQFYKIEIKGSQFPDWTTLGGTHNNTVVNGQLEVLFAEGLTPGDYQIRLAIVDHNAGFLQQPYVVPLTVQQ